MEILHKLEPYFEKEFRIFDGYLKLSLEDQASCLNQELYKY